MCKIIESNNPPPAQTLNITSLEQYTYINMYTQNDKRHFLTMTNEGIQNIIYFIYKYKLHIFSYKKI